VTLKELKSKTLVEIQNHNPGSVLPNINAELRAAVAGLAREVGGIPRTANLTLTAGTREYGSDYSNFPTDIYASVRMYRGSTGVRILPMTVQDRNESVSATGDPNQYYVWRRKLGFDRIPTQNNEIIWHYKGLCNDFSEETDTILDDWPQQQDDDILWDTIIFHVAMVYYRRKMTGDRRDPYYNLFNLYKHEKNSRIIRIRANYQLLNQDEAPMVDLDADYFSVAWNGSSKSFSNIVNRIGDSGDVVRIL